MFRHSMFGVFEVQYFGVRSKTNLYDYIFEFDEKTVLIEGWTTSLKSCAVKI